MSVGFQHAVWTPRTVNLSPTALPRVGMTLSTAVSWTCLFAVIIGLGGMAKAQSVSGGEREQAEELIRAHQWDRGIEVLKPVLRSDPLNPKVLNLAGLAYTGKGEREEADRYFEAAIKVDPHFVPSLKNLGVNEVALGRVKSARAHLESALQDAPSDAVINLYLGEICYRQADFPHAAVYLRRAPEFVARDANLHAALAVAELKAADLAGAMATLDGLESAKLNARTQLELGVALAEADVPDRAIPYFEDALQRYPAAGDIAYDLALCYMATKRFPDAIRVLEKPNGSGHETAEADNVLAEAYEAEHQTQPAVDAIRRAIALDPADDNNYLEFASICIDHQAYEDAGKVLAVGLNVHPNSPRLLFERGVLHAMQDHFDLAEKDFQRSADLAPGDTAASYGLGVTFLETGNAASAIPILRERLQKSPNDANLLYLLGEALLRAGAKQGDGAFGEAENVLAQSARINPKLVDPHVELGTIYLRQGRLQPAVNELEEARRLDPKSNSAYSHLAIAYRRLGEQEKAKEVLNELKKVLDQERTGTRSPLEAAHLGSENPKTINDDGSSN